jgi:hypothetical protein
LKRSTEEASTRKGSFKPPFRKPFPPNRPNPTTEGLNFESLQYALQTILEAHDNSASIPPESSEDVVEEEVPKEEDSSPPIFGHLSDNIFQANFETVHPYNTRSKTQNKPPSEASKNVFPKQSKKTEIKQILTTPVLEYDLIEDLKKLRANIYVFELLKFPLILQKMLQSIAENSKKSDSSSKKSAEIDSNAAKNVPTKNTSKPPEKRDFAEKTVANVNKIVLGTTTKNQQNSVVNTRKNVPPFLLTFEIFNRNVHNCMVDSGASSKVMPLSVFQKINVEVKPSDLKIIQLDQTNVKVIGELKNVLIRLSSNPKVNQIIDIIVVDIPEFYGLFLSRDWSEQLHGYFSTDWSHLWLPENGQPNKIKINKEHYLKHTVTDLNDTNEPFITSANSFETQGMNTFFGNFMTEISPITDPAQQSEVVTCTQTSSFPSMPSTSDDAQIWSLYFDGSKSKEGAGVGCVLIDPTGNKTFIACRLEFECTNK